VSKDPERAIIRASFSSSWGRKGPSAAISEYPDTIYPPIVSIGINPAILYGHVAEKGEPFSGLGETEREEHSANKRQDDSQRPIKPRLFP
jgi:hypothetical protein